MICFLLSSSFFKCRFFSAEADAGDIEKKLVWHFFRTANSSTLCTVRSWAEVCLSESHPHNLPAKLDNAEQWIQSKNKKKDSENLRDRDITLRILASSPP